MKAEHIDEYTFDSQKVTNPIEYFHNEQGDYTITFHGRPLCYVKIETDAVALRNSFNALTLRIDVQLKQLKQARAVEEENKKLREGLQSIAEENYDDDDKKRHLRAIIDRMKDTSISLLSPTTKEEKV